MSDQSINIQVKYLTDHMILNQDALQYPHRRVQRVFCLQDPWAHHQPKPLCVWSRHVPQLSRPVAFSTGVVAVAGSAIIAPTILDNTTTTTTTTTTRTPTALTYNSLLHFHPACVEQKSHSRKSAPTTCCDARDTTLRPPPPINTTPGSALTPTALPIVPESRLHATACEGSLGLIFDDHRFRAGKDHRKLPLDMLNGQ